MKKSVLYLALVGAVAMALPSCNKERSESQKPEYISVSTNIGGMSRVTADGEGNQVFEVGDEISVYAWTGDKNAAPAAADRVVDNSINKLETGSKWVATPQMLWKNMVDEHFFIGVYPKDASSVADLTSADYNLNVADQEASDLLIATEFSGKIASDNPVNLTFDHVMAKVKVNLDFRNQWDVVGKVVEKVEFKNVATTAKVNYLTKTVTAGTDRESALAVPMIKKDESFESILIPQSGVNTIVITVKSEGSSKGYTYTRGTDFKFESGKVTTINLIVGRDQIDLGTVKINNWVDGETIEGGEALD
ncbi:MAG TPA: hypothetical protein DD383_01355 [Rikenellaceae bacterium]|nr:hypothetical protein [Rikenellaceae bacterium]HBN01271.1 hypothetical protein [Rikenellaceae bacterium]